MNTIKIVSLVCLALLMTRCNLSPKQEATRVEEAKADVDIAKDHVDEATQELRLARLDSAKAFSKFKEESNQKLAENDQKIAALKVRMERETKELQVKYKEELDELNQKNDQLKARILENKEATSTKWVAFKHEFNRDLDALGRGISTLANRNAKKK